MKTIRLLYPDYLSGGLETYYFGAHLLAHILPQNENQPLYKVELAPPDGRERPVTDGVCARDEEMCIRDSSLSRALATERAMDVFPVPGGPTRQRMGASPFFVSVRTARYSNTRSFTFSRP